MASPRHVLLEGVRDCLAQIRVAHGYLTDAGAAVTLEPAPVASPESSDAFVSPVWVRQQRATDPAKVRSHRLTTVQVVAKLPATLTDAQERLDAMVTDIERAMSGQLFRFPTSFENPQYQQAEPLAAAVAAGWVGVALTYTSHIPIQPQS